MPDFFSGLGLPEVSTLPAAAGQSGRVFLAGGVAYLSDGTNWLPLSQPNTTNWFGDGSAGDVTISSGTTTLSDNAYYDDLTISGTGSLVPGHNGIFVAGTLDLTAAPANAIRNTGGNGSNASGATGGAGGAQPSEGAMTSRNAIGITGATGTTGAGTAASEQPVQYGPFGYGGGHFYAAGDGSNAGSTGRLSLPIVEHRILAPTMQFAQGGSESWQPWFGGAAGRGGGAGGGSGSAAGGGGGGGGSAAPPIVIFARKINRGSSTATAAISTLGGNGGNGGNGVGANCGGGTGGGGASGSWILIVYEELLGTSAANALESRGGNGGNGGSPGSGTTNGGGSGGDGGGAGAIYLFNVRTGEMSVHRSNFSNVDGNARSGNTPGTGGTGNYQRAAL